MHGESQVGEGDHLGEARERGVEAFDLPFVRGPLVAEHDAGQEDRQEARAVGDGCGSEEHTGADQGADRMQPFTR